VEIFDHIQIARHGDVHAFIVSERLTAVARPDVFPNIGGINTADIDKPLRVVIQRQVNSVGTANLAALKEGVKNTTETGDSRATPEVRFGRSLSTKGAYQ
jgi:hypothetical protein